MAALDTESDPCHQNKHIEGSRGPLVSAVMFGAGVLGNLAALLLLEVRRRRRGGGAKRRSLFQVLVTALVLMDLAGTCLVSPVVQVAYAYNTSLVAMGPAACQYFGFTMTFFSLATLSLLLAMATERGLAIGHPYLYSRHCSKRRGCTAITVAVALCALFCLLPFTGLGMYVQYCPGTWCFIDMNPKQPSDRAYATLYASLMLLLVLLILACNTSVCYQLVRMYQRRRSGRTLANQERRGLSLAEELEHLLLLGFMTLVFIICTLPLVVRVYINAYEQRDAHRTDLIALLFLSVNPILDPWVFIFLSPGVLHFCWASLCCSPLPPSRAFTHKSSLGREPSGVPLQTCQTTLGHSDNPGSALV